MIGRDVYVSVIGPNVGTYGFRTSDGRKQFYSSIGEYNPVISNGRRMFLTGSNALVQFTPHEAHTPKKARRKQAKHKKHAKQQHGGGKSKAKSKNAKHQHHQGKGQGGKPKKKS